MNKKVIIRIEYERDGTRRTFYGQIDEDKVEVFHAGEESFMCLMNDGEITWIDKEAILSIYELETKLRVYEKDRMENASFLNKQNLRISSY